MRAILLLFHRYVGLAIAGFLIVAGLTGSVIAWQREADAWLNPALFHAGAGGRVLPLSEMVRRVERAMPDIRVTAISPQGRIGDSVEMSAEGRNGAPPSVDDLFVDPVSGKLLGARLWGAARLDALHIIPLLYRLHYTLLLPGNWGVWVMGGVALVWMLDCIVAFGLTLPRARPFLAKWRSSWRVKRGAKGYRRTLDLHRASGLWLWPLLFLMAVTGVGLTLHEELFRPILVHILPTSAQAGDDLASIRSAPVRIDWDDAAEMAKRKAMALHWPSLVVSRIILDRDGGVFIVRLGDADMSGFGSSAIAVAANDGRILSVERAGEGQAGDRVDRLIFPLHSGQVAGVGGRILVCAIGLIVALLSVTGILIWRRKHVVRRKASSSSRAIHVRHV